VNEGWTTGREDCSKRPGRPPEICFVWLPDCTFSRGGPSWAPFYRVRGAHGGTPLQLSQQPTEFSPSFF
jgi:hypothetical protein